MTRKEAIPVLKELEAYFESLIKADPHFLDKEQAEKDLEAIQYGRNSLEVDEQYQIEYEKAEYCGDCISREDAVYAITETELDQGAFADAKMRINELPSVQPKSRKGNWIMFGRLSTCSECNYSHDFSTYAESRNYCPKCGADMRESEE